MVTTLLFALQDLENTPFQEQTKPKETLLLPGEAVRPEASRKVLGAAPEAGVVQMPAHSALHP